MTKKTKGDYEVGYGKPPKATRFQPGQSGNRSGRPKRPRSSNEIFEAVMSEKVAILINGRRRQVTMKEAMIRRLVAEGTKGNQRALNALMKRESERILDESVRTIEEKQRQKDAAAAAIRMAELLDIAVKRKEEANQKAMKSVRREDGEPDDSGC